MYGACDLVVAAVGWVLVVEIPLACCCADRANVLDCVCHGVLSVCDEVNDGYNESAHEYERGYDAKANVHLVSDKPV